MAVTIQSDIVKNYFDKNRTKTLNYRGTLLNTGILGYDTHWASSDPGSVLYATLIPFNACIRQVNICFSANISELVFDIGVAGIDSANNIIEIKNLVTGIHPLNPPLAAETIVDVWPATLWTKSIYNQLCDGDNNPIEEFKRFSNDRYGVLYFKSTTKNVEDVPHVNININWVESSPSEAPLVKSYV